MLKPNVVEITCLRCNRSHFTFTDEIAGSDLWNVCETCLTPEEKISQKELWRLNLDKKYEELLKKYVPPAKIDTKDAYLGLPK